jgi:hypothetical protein
VKPIRVRLAALLFVALVAVAACEEGDEAFIRDFLISWAAEHPGSTVTGLLGIGSGNEVTAAVDALRTIDNVNKADDLMEAGRTNRDADKMDEAIKLRPSDFSYKVSRASLALEQGDYVRYTLLSRQAAADAKEQWGSSAGRSTRAQQSQEYRELVDVSHRLSPDPGDVSRFKNYDQCATLYDKLLESSRNAEITGSQSPAADVAAWNDRRSYCIQLQ